jgi:H+-translocating NAD(P) transhydrogenase subunit alpha
MQPVKRLLAWLLFIGLLFTARGVWSSEAAASAEKSASSLATADQAAASASPDPAGTAKFTRLQVLVGSLTVFTLAVIVGFEIIAKVPPTLDTPLMSGSNAISGITIVGALIAAGNSNSPFASFLGLIAVILANINVVGGFCVTHRMLLMFKKR